MTNTYDRFMFEGFMIDGRLANERWLEEQCTRMYPEFFAPDNPWTIFVREHFTSWRTARPQNWQCRPMTSDEMSKRILCFTNMLLSPCSQLPGSTRVAILGWMLSNILREVPAS